MRKGLVVLAAVALVAALAVPAALAEKPIREPLPADDFTIPATICGFEVEVEFLANKAKALIFSSGRMTVTGQLMVRLTNADDATKSIELNIPGPGFFDETGLTGTGPWLLFFEEDELAPGTPALLVFVSGHFRIDENGYTLLGGTEIDLCEALASS
jgi:hypothetical protein